ncbi:hypothetical protein ACFQXB_15500 [Plastorhodobacter daqingensis]|uniref:Transposase n=1 Tax=Plastorhodobacter daqingensis TaxID=1387281 RepID=A0ABW2ULJ0_9RHOB
MTAREVRVGMRIRLENEIGGLLKTFGVMLGKRVGGFAARDAIPTAMIEAMLPSWAGDHGRALDW